MPGESHANVSSEFIGGDLVFKDKTGAEIFRIDGTNAQMYGPRMVRTLRRRCTVAEINAGLTLLAAIAGFKYRFIDITLIAVGGNASGATAVEVYGVQSSSTVALISAAVAALTRSTVVKPNTANVTVLADGASHVPNDVNTAITIGKTGGSLATATNVDVILTYALEA